MNLAKCLLDSPLFFSSGNLLAAWWKLKSEENPLLYGHICILDIISRTQYLLFRLSFFVNNCSFDESDNRLAKENLHHPARQNFLPVCVT